MKYQTRETEIARRCAELEAFTRRDGLREREARLGTLAGAHPPGDGNVSERTLAALAAFVAVSREREFLGQGIEA